MGSRRTCPEWSERSERTHTTQLINGKDLVELNISLIDTFANYLEINSKRARLSKILANFGQKN
jgi:hypothetical protein